MTVPYYAHPSAAVKAPPAIHRAAVAAGLASVGSSGAETPASALRIYTADSAGRPVLPAVPPWDKAAARRFEALAARYALDELTPEERGELALLNHSREQAEPGMTYEEFKRRVERERARDKLLKCLEDYVFAHA